MKEEFKRLLDLFSLSQEGKLASVDEVLKESVVFFDKLKDVFKTGSEDEKKEMLHVMNQMYSKLLTESQTLVKKSGMTDEQLEQFCDNPQNFTKEQWQMMEEARRQMLNSGREISRYLQGKPSEASSSEPPARPRKSSSKDRWLRS